MIAELQIVPGDAVEWERWAWHHRDHHQQIIAAIQQQTKATLPEYQVEPIPWNHFDQFVTNNEQMHIDMNQAMGMQGTELGDLDLRHTEELPQWIYSHWLEHQQIAVRLGI